MAGFGNTPVTTGTPVGRALGSVAVPGHAGGDLTALEGGPASTDSNGNETSPVAAWVKNANANGQATMANSSPVAFSSDQSPPRAATGTKSNVASSATSVTVLASNANRRGAMIYNDSTQILYLDLSGGTASATSYSLQVPSNGLYELPGSAIYTGAITGIWASANGNARVTELS